MRRLLAVSALAALVACGDMGPTLDVDFEQLSSDVTSSPGTDSVSGYLVTGSEILLNGVIYAGVSCDGLQWRGERPFGRLRVTIMAYPGAGCPRIQSRIAYRMTLLDLTPGTYHVEVIHDEPESATRGRRTVFSGTIDVR